MVFDEGWAMTSAGHVLIVEDDAATREMLATVLSAEGFRAVAAEDGLEAMHLLRTLRHSEPQSPCLVLLDLRMPRLGGHEFRKAQLADPIVAGVPVAVMSGAADAREWARTLGAVATLAKPLEVDVLLEVVRRYCATQPQPETRL
jgi:two-component system chemotaxis response regulator CheY